MTEYLNAAARAIGAAAVDPDATRTTALMNSAYGANGRTQFMRDWLIQRWLTQYPYDANSTSPNTTIPYRVNKGLQLLTRTIVVGQEQTYYLLKAPEIMQWLASRDVLIGITPPDRPRQNLPLSDADIVMINTMVQNRMPPPDGGTPGGGEGGMSGSATVIKGGQGSTIGASSASGGAMQTRRGFGQSAGVSASSGVATSGRVTGGTAAGTSQTRARALKTGRVRAFAIASSGGTARLSRVRYRGATAAAVAVMTGRASRVRRVAGQGAGVGVVTGRVVRSRPVSGRASGVGAGRGVAVRRRVVKGTTAGVSWMRGGLVRKRLGLAIDINLPGLLLGLRLG